MCDKGGLWDSHNSFTTWGFGERVGEVVDRVYRKGPGGNECLINKKLLPLHLCFEFISLTRF